MAIRLLNLFGVRTLCDKGSLESLLARWWQRLLTLLPAFLERALSPPAPTYRLIRILDEQLFCGMGQGETFSELERIIFVEKNSASQSEASILSNPAMQRYPLVLLLEPHQVLSQSLVLPLEVEDNLDQFFIFDMDRLAGVSVDAVYFTYQVNHRDQAGQKLTLTLYVVYRDVLHNLLDRLSSASFVFHGVDVAKNHAANADDATFEGQGINLLPPARCQRLSRYHLWMALLCTVAALFALVMANSFVSAAKLERIDRWEQQLNLIRQDASSVIDLRKKVEASALASRFVLEKKRDSQSLSSVLYRLTTVLPNHTHIERLYVNGNSVELHGLSDSAASLIPLLEKTPWFYNAILRAAITRDKTTQKERYKVRVRSNAEALNNYNSLPSSLEKKSSVNLTNKELDKGGAS